MHDRIKKINELIRHQISQLIVRDVEFPESALVTVTAVETSKDLHHANIYVSVLPAGLEKQAIKALYEARLFEPLYKKLSLKPLPKIYYLVDRTEQKANEIEHLLDDIGKKQ